MRPAAIALTGRTRAGKTTLALGLNAVLGWPWGSFSAYVRAEAARRKIPERRAELQDLGADLLEGLGPDGFCAATLAHNGLTRPPYVIEGARHVKTVEALERLSAPHPLHHIHLAVSDHERNRRLVAEGVSAEEGATWEEHSTEREGSLLRRRASLVICADEPVAVVLARAVNWLAQP